MSFINLDQLPFVGMSHEFVGETQGAPFSAYIVSAKPGQGPPLHTHPYVEVAFTLEGCATITVGDEQREVQAGGIVVIPAGTPHRFVNSGDTLLRQIDVHASPKFIQTNLTCYFSWRSARSPPLLHKIPDELRNLIRCGIVYSTFNSSTSNTSIPNGADSPL